VFDIVHAEFNKCRRTATKALINDVMNSNLSRPELAKKHRVSNNKIADIRRYIKELKKGQSFAYRGVAGYVYRLEV